MLSSSTFRFLFVLFVSSPVNTPLPYPSLRAKGYHSFELVATTCDNCDDRLGKYACSNARSPVIAAPATPGVAATGAAASTSPPSSRATDDAGRQILLSVKHRAQLLEHVSDPAVGAVHQLEVAVPRVFGDGSRVVWCPRCPRGSGKGISRPPRNWSNTGTTTVSSSSSNGHATGGLATRSMPQLLTTGGATSHSLGSHASGAGAGGGAGAAAAVPSHTPANLLAASLSATPTAFSASLGTQSHITASAATPRSSLTDDALAALGVSFVPSPPSSPMSSGDSVTSYRSTSPDEPSSDEGGAGDYKLHKRAGSTAAAATMQSPPAARRCATGGSLLRQSLLRNINTGSTPPTLTTQALQSLGGFSPTAAGRVPCSSPGGNSVSSTGSGGSAIRRAARASSDTMTLATRLPEWNPKTRTLIMEFDPARVADVSSKNFLLLSEFGETACAQFGRLKQGRYSLDVAHPLSLLQAFGIFLSTFQWRGHPDGDTPRAGATH